MWKSILISTLMIGIMIAYSIGDTSPTFAKGGKGGKGGGGKGGRVSRGGGGRGGGGVSRGGGDMSRGRGGVPRGGGVSRGGISSGGSGSSSANVKRSGGGSSTGGHGRGGGYSGYRGNAKGSGRYGGGHRHRHSYGRFYFGPFGYGHGYYGNWFGIATGLPLYPHYYDYYTQPYFVRPHYTDYGVPYVDGQPAADSAYTVPPTATNGAVIPTLGNAANFQLQAEQAFREHRYEDAARLCNHAIVEDSQNGKLHLFNAQALFALGEYGPAAAAIQHGAALLDRSEWGFVVEHYKEFYRGDDYVVQMAQLVRFIKENPTEAYAYFLRGYHYKFLSYNEAARKQLAKAVELESRDRLAAELLGMAGGEVPSSVPQPPPPPTAEEVAVPDNTTEQIPAEASSNP